MVEEDGQMGRLIEYTQPALGNDDERFGELTKTVTGALRQAGGDVLALKSLLLSYTDRVSFVAEDQAEIDAMREKFLETRQLVALERMRDKEALIRILVEPKNALVKQYQRLFEMENIELTFADEALGAVARRAIERKTGARGLRSILESILLETMFDLPGLEGVEEVVISREVVEGTARPLYIYADRADRASTTRSTSAEPTCSTSER